MGITEDVARFAIETRTEDIPEAVLQITKEHMLDTIGCMVAGAAEPAGRIMTQYVKEMESKPEVVVVGSGFRASPPAQRWRTQL